ncbi:MAG: PDZ domain-containing protein, partial [Planctomycetota bacterium]
GEPVTSVKDLRNRIAETSPGTKVKLEVFRDGNTKTLRVKIGRREPESYASAAPGEPADLGMALADLSPNMRNRLGLSADEGVVVTSVDPAGPAARSGLQANDVILTVQGRPVSSVAQFYRELSKHDLKKGVRLTVQTGDLKRFVLLRSME